MSFKKKVQKNIQERKAAAEFKAAMKASREDGRDRELDFNGIPVTIKGGTVDYDEFMKNMVEKDRAEDKE